MNRDFLPKPLLVFVAEEEGATAIEYAIMLALIIGVCIASASFLATATEQSFERSGQAISGAIGN